MSDNILGMSDEDFIRNAGKFEEYTEGAQNEPQDDNVDEVDQEDTQEEYVEQEASEELEDKKAEEEYTDEEPETVEEEESNTDEPEEKETSSETDASVDDLKRLLQPFKANGKDVQVKSVDEALTLMQMGANYTKKMQALQPNLKMLKTLEKNNLLTEDKINFLIDLNKKDPKAIAQLIKDAELDPMDLETDVEYTPTNHQVSAEALRLEEVLDSLESTPTYSKCIDVVGNQWDEGSRTEFRKNPVLFQQLNEQMSLGIYDKIAAEVERVKMFGGLQGMSDFDAYRSVGKSLYEKGELSVPTRQPKPVARTQVKQKDAQLTQQRRAATTPKTSRTSVRQDTLNPLAMDDNEFLKINNIRL